MILQHGRGPSTVDCGPICDLEILDKHVELLEEEDKEMAEIYKLISQHIIDQYVG